ncbi:MAG TPA: hypothetical protein VL025_18295, partial [Thermoanaerobaculia bacterium]|nr:hypothetical protein [Thermoanaerobaculia bacterium]
EVPALDAGLDAALSRGWDRDRMQARIASRTWKAVGREVAEEIRAALGLPLQSAPDPNDTVAEVPVYASQEVAR